MGRIALIIVVAIVLVIAAGAAGYTLGNQAGFQRANQVRQQFFAGRGTGGQGAFGGGGTGTGTGGNGSGAFARNIQGSIKSVNGDTMVVTIGQRDVTVNITSQTQINKEAPGSKDQLAAGTRVLITPEGGAGGFGGGGAGGSGGTGSTTGGAGGSNGNTTINAASILITGAQ